MRFCALSGPSMLRFPDFELRRSFGSIFRNLGTRCNRLDFIISITFLTSEKWNHAPRCLWPVHAFVTSYPSLYLRSIAPTMAGCRSASSRLFSALVRASIDFGDVGEDATLDNNALAFDESPPLPESRLSAQNLWVLIVGGVTLGEASGYLCEALEDGLEELVDC